MNTESEKKWKKKSERTAKRKEVTVVFQDLSKIWVCHVVGKEINDVIPATFDIQLKKKKFKYEMLVDPHFILT